MKSIQKADIPTHWPPSVAVDVINFLHHITDKIWDTYEEDVLAQINPTENTKADIPKDNDIPF